MLGSRYKAGIIGMQGRGNSKGDGEMTIQRLALVLGIILFVLSAIEGFIDYFAYSGAIGIVLMLSYTWRLTK